MRQVEVSVGQMKLSVHGMAMDIAKAEFATGTLWFNLCSYIREHNVPEDIVREEMDAVGFKPSRISEVLKVCAAPADVWDMYLGRMIGFKKTLQLARVAADGAVTEVTEAGKLFFGERAASEGRKVEEVAKEAMSDKGSETVAPQVSPKSKCDRAASVIFKFSTKGRHWRSDGWLLTLSRVKTGKGLKGGVV